MRRNLVRAATGTILCYVLLRLFVFDIYFIRSSSMRSTLLEGDYVLVNKFFLNNPDRFDIVVFDPPVSDSTFGEVDSYVKRCIGMPGDTVRIEKSTLYVNGIQILIPGVQYHYHVISSSWNPTDSVWNSLGIDQAQKVAGSSAFSVFMTAAQADSIRLNPGVLSAEITCDEPGWFDPNVFPYSQELKWNLDHFGPLMIPAKGTNIPLDAHNLTLYKGIILLFEKKLLEQKDGKVFVDGTEALNYIFENDYYFVMGDNRHASSDSRAWGLVPASHIQGTTSLLLWSNDPNTENSRNGRTLKTIH